MGAGAGGEAGAWAAHSRRSVDEHVPYPRICAASFGSADALVLFSNMPPSRHPSTLLTDAYAGALAGTVKLNRSYADYREVRWLLEHEATSAASQHDSLLATPALPSLPALPLAPLSLTSISSYFYSPEASSLDAAAALASAADIKGSRRGIKRGAAASARSAAATKPKLCARLE